MRLKGDDEGALLEAVLKGDQAAWRRFVRRYDGPLRQAVSEAAADQLTASQIDDVMGDLWLCLVDGDMKRLRTLKSGHRCSFLAWLTMQASRIAAGHMRADVREPELEPLSAAKNVAAPSPRPSSERIASAAEDWLRGMIREAVREEVSALLHRSPANGAPTKHPGGYLSVAEAARLVGVHEATIRAWIKSGELPGHHAGRHHRVKRDELERFLSRRKESGPLDLDARAAELAAA